MTWRDRQRGKPVYRRQSDELGTRLRASAERLNDLARGLAQQIDQKENDHDGRQPGTR